MRILLIGSGAREHALAWKLSLSPNLEKMYAAPGNPGIAEFAELVDIKVNEIEQLVAFSKSTQIDLVAVGPEVPLVLGLADCLKEEGILCFGPAKAGAVLEGSKRFAKDFMKKYEIPTANYASFSDSSEAQSYINALPEGPIVVKADGLAQGKGVIVAENHKEALEAIQNMIGDQCFGSAGSEVVIEEFLTGEEVSLLTFVDGKSIIPMLPVQDHKRIGDGDVGLNTGGMGTYSPTSVYTPEIAKMVEVQIIAPLEKALQEELDYCGCLYIGLMLTPNGPKVIEFNARFGDPETEVLMPLLESDLLKIFCKCATGTLTEDDVQWKNKSAVCVIMASKGYPETYQSGYEITGLQKKEDSFIFHAGTKLDENNEIVTSGGRVLAVVSVRENFIAAKKAVYQHIEGIHFKNAYFRSDIGHREEKRNLRK